MGILLTLIDGPPDVLFDFLNYDVPDTVRSVCKILDFWAALAIVAIPCFLLVLVITWIGRRVLEPWARSVLWSFVLLRLTIPLSYEVPISVQNVWNLLPSQSNTLRDAERDWLLSIPEHPDSYSIVTPEEMKQWERLQPRRLSDRLTDVVPNLFEILHLWWIVGSSTLAIGSFLTFVQLMRWQRDGVDCLDENSLEILSDGCRRFGLRTVVRLRTVPQLHCPMIIDRFRAVILLPDSFAALPEPERRLVIWHGLARVCRYDSLASFLLFVGRLFQWWNPLFWWAAHRWRLEREAACRELLLSRLDPDQIAASNEVIRASSGKQVGQTCLAKWFPDFGFLHLTDATTAPTQCPTEFSSHQFGRVRHWVTCCLLLLCGVACLTVSPTSNPSDRPIHLPVGSTWEEPIPSRVGAEVARTYELGPCLDRLQLHTPSIGRGSQIGEIRNAVSRLLRPWGSRDGTKATQAVLDHYHTQIEDEQLTVNASASQHDLIARMMASWQEHGRRRILVRCRHYTVQSELNDLLPTGGGRIINASSAADRYRRLPNIRNQRAEWSQSGTGSALPLLVRPMTDVEYFFLYHKEFGDARISWLMSPEFNLADGDSGRSARDSGIFYSTGLNANSSYEFDGTNSTAGDLEVVEVAVHSLGTDLFLQLHFHLYDVSDVTSRHFQIGSTISTIQFPLERFLTFEIKTVVKDAGTLLVVPLVRNPPNGELLLCFVSCRILEPEDEEKKLIGVPRAN